MKKYKCNNCRELINEDDVKEVGVFLKNKAHEYLMCPNCYAINTLFKVDNEPAVAHNQKNKI